MKCRILFIIILIAAIVLRIVYYMGPSGADDIIYFSVVEKLLANQDVGTTISSSKHWGVRLGMIMPVWAAMKTFGVSAFTSYLFPLSASAGTLILVYIIGKRLFNPPVAVISSAFFALLPQDVYLSTVIYPDGPVVLFSVLFIYMFYKLSENEDTDVRQSILAGLVLGFAYYIRETALILLITIPVLFPHAQNKKNFFRTTILILAGLLAAIVLEMFVFWLLTGDPLVRWEILLGKTKVLEPREFTVYSHSNVKSGNLLIKYLFDPFFVIFATHWISPLMAIVAAGAGILQMTRKENCRFFSLKKGHFLWLFILTFIILAYFIYGPVYGFTVPLKRDIRYYHTITPLASLLAGVIVYELLAQNGVKKFIGGLLLIFYILASSVCLGSIVNKNVQGLDLIEQFMAENPAENYVMPVMLKKTLQFKKGADLDDGKIIAYNYDGWRKMERQVSELLTSIRKEGTAQYVFVIPQIQEIQIRFRIPIKWPMEKLEQIAMMTTLPSMSCRILKASDTIFNLTPDAIKSKICFTTDVYVYRLK